MPGAERITHVATDNKPLSDLVREFIIAKIGSSIDLPQVEDHMEPSSSHKSIKHKHKHKKKHKRKSSHKEKKSKHHDKGTISHNAVESEPITKGNGDTSKILTELPPVDGFIAASDFSEARDACAIDVIEKLSISTTCDKGDENLLCSSVVLRKSSSPSEKVDSGLATNLIDSGVTEGEKVAFITEKYVERISEKNAVSEKERSQHIDHIDES